MVITQKCRKWQYWKEWKSEPPSHTSHGKTKLKVLLKQSRERPREEEFRVIYPRRSVGHENTCAQIFTDGEFVQIIPMRYKSEAGTTLDRINQDVGGTKTYLCTMHPRILVIKHK